MTGEQATSVTDLRLVAVAPEHTHLVLEDSENHQYRVPVDARLVAALRTDPARRDRPGQLEISLQSQLSPREIQTRIRAGHTVDEVAHAAGISLERVERYAAPVVAEREHVVEQAQRAPGRRATGGSAPALQDLVGTRLREQRVPEESVEWDAWRGADDAWTVRLAYLAGGRHRVATWAFDPRGRVLAPADEEARWLVDDSGADRGTEEPTAAVRRLSSVPGTGDEGTGPDPADEVYDREVDEARDVEEPVRQAAAGRGRRPHVPSWDDIMFGTRRRD